MSGHGRRLQMLPDQRFDCRSCGRCCRDWSITFSEADYQRLSKIDWAEAFPELAGQTLFVRHGSHAGRLVWRFALRRDDGACWFLSADERCRMHERLGLRGKAVVCRSFPFSTVETPVGTFVSLRHNCPTVAEGGHGRPLADQRKELEHLVRDARSDRAKAARLAGADPSSGPAVSETVAFAPGYRLGWDDILRVEQTLDAVLANRELSLSGRLIVASVVLASLRGAASEHLQRVAVPVGLIGQSAAVGVDPDLIYSMVLDEEAAGPQGPRPRPTLLHRLVVRHMLRNVVRRRWSMDLATAGMTRRLVARAGLFGRDVSLLLGLGTLEPDGFAAAVSMRRIETACWSSGSAGASRDADEPLERFIRAKLFGKSFFGAWFHGLSYTEGFAFVVLACSLARAVALGAWLSRGAEGQPGRDEICEGIVAVEDALYSATPLSRLRGRALALALLDVDALARTTRWWDWSRDQRK